MCSLGGSGVQYIVLLIVVIVLGVGMPFAIRRRLSGQADMDDVDQ